MRGYDADITSMGKLLFSREAKSLNGIHSKPCTGVLSRISPVSSPGAFAKPVLHMKTNQHPHSLNVLE